MCCCILSESSLHLFVCLTHTSLSIAHLLICRYPSIHPSLSIYSSISLHLFIILFSPSVRPSLSIYSSISFHLFIHFLHLFIHVSLHFTISSSLSLCTINPHPLLPSSWSTKQPSTVIALVLSSTVGDSQFGPRTVPSVMEHTTTPRVLKRTLHTYQD